ncbi:hypothetical protein OXX80_004083 [Metschnikowia pulcherrima]
MSDEYMQALEIQRRNFEAQFGSLEEMGFKDRTTQAESSDSDSDSGSNRSSDNSSSSEDESDFGGFDSEDESAIIGKSSDFSARNSTVSPKLGSVKGPKVVSLTESFTPTGPKKNDRKLARSGRVPTIQEQEEKQRQLNKLTKKQQQQAAKEDSENLENDLKLQRLLSESHILAHNVEHSGADLTLQTIDYEAPEYEREAREAGIVLSRVKKGEVRNLDSGRGATVASDRLGVGKKQGPKIRDRGLRIHSVGKSTRNGLRISQSEIDRVNSGKRRK